jgi:hypothetical protein
MAKVILILLHFASEPERTKGLVCLGLQTGGSTLRAIYQISTEERTVTERATTLPTGSHL